MAFRLAMILDRRMGLWTDLATGAQEVRPLGWWHRLVARFVVEAPKEAPLPEDREDLSVECPSCGALPGVRCWTSGYRGIPMRRPPHDMRG